MTTHAPPRVLTIGGSDSGGSAGIQADLKTLTACGVFGMNVITALTAQNTLGVQGIHPIPIEFIAAQAEAVLNDEGADVIKVGFLGRAEVVTWVADLAARYPHIPLVVDPVLVNGAGALIVSPETLAAYRTQLIPRAAILTPNLDEASLLADYNTVQGMEALQNIAHHLHGLGARYVLIKGGHLPEEGIMDVFYNGHRFTIFTAERLPINNPHGVGCTLASAIAAYLAKGCSMDDAVQNAHQYLQRALAGCLAWELGAGRAAVNHFYQFES